MGVITETEWRTDVMVASVIAITVLWAQNVRQTSTWSGTHGSDAMVAKGGLLRKDAPPDGPATACKAGRRGELGRGRDAIQGGTKRRLRKLGGSRRPAICRERRPASCARCPDRTDPPSAIPEPRISFLPRRPASPALPRPRPAARTDALVSRNPWRRCCSCFAGFLKGISRSTEIEGECKARKRQHLRSCSSHNTAFELHTADTASELHQTHQGRTVFAKTILLSRLPWWGVSASCRGLSVLFAILCGM